MESRDNHKQITKLINASTIWPRIIRLHVSVWQKYTLIVQVAREKNFKAGQWIETDDWKWWLLQLEQRSGVEGRSTSHYCHGLGGHANHCWLSEIQSQCFYYCHKLSSLTGKWNKRRDLPSNSLYFIQSASCPELLLFPRAENRMSSHNKPILVWMNFTFYQSANYSSPKRIIEYPTTGSDASNLPV